jgi:hypothetical protein
MAYAHSQVCFTPDLRRRMAPPGSKITLFGRDKNYRGDKIQRSYSKEKKRVTKSRKDWG